MNFTRRFFIPILVLTIFGLAGLAAQPVPQYELKIGNPVLSGATYQFDVLIRRVGSTPFRIGNSQFILAFNAGAFSAPAISRVASSEQIGTGFFYDQVISGSELRISLGGNGSFANATDIPTAGPGSRVATYRVTGVNVPVLSAGLTWINLPAIVRTGVSEINASDNYRDITDLTGASHINGGGEFGRISGYKFNDLNGDGNWQQPAEPPLDGWTVNLSGPNGPFSTVTGSGAGPTGYYEFDNLTPGDYTVSEVVQAGWSPTATPANPNHLVAGQQIQNLNFGNYDGPAIVGMKFNDLNGNGTRDLGEPGLADWQIVATKAGGGGLKTALTNGSGNYALTFLPSEAGTWQISETMQPGWIQTRPTPPNTYTILVQSGTFAPGTDFGNFLGSSIGGMKFNDVNGDSINGPGDTPIAGWRIRLTKNGNQIDSTLTDSFGHYLFDSLPTGSYAVIESSAAGWIQTLPPSAGGYPVSVTTGGTVITGKDFGNYRLALLSGTVYYDVSHDGTQNGSEPGMAGIGINAVSATRSYHVSTTVGGGWTIPGVLAETYTISEQVPPGYHLTEPVGETYTEPVTSGSTITGLKFGNSAVADTTRFRTFSYESMALSQVGRGKTGPGTRKPDKVQFCARVINQTDKPVTFLRVFFRVPVYVNDTAYPMHAFPPPLSIETGFDGKEVDLAWTDSIGVGDTVTICGWGRKSKIQSASYLWRNGVPTVTTLHRAEFTLDQARLPMPNAANLYDEVFFDRGFGEPGTGGLIAGIPRTDAPRNYGWVRIRNEKDLKKSFLDRSGLHTDNTHGYSDLVHRPLVKEQRTLPPLKQNNRLFADLATLKLNIVASALGITPHGLGQLVYDDGLSPLSGLTVVELAARADSLLTFWRGLLAGRFVGVDTVIARITTAFEGPIDTLSFGPALVYTGARTLQSVPFLRANPGAVPVVIDRSGFHPAYLPVNFSLHQNYPNPFNPTTTIGFDVPSSGLVTLKIYNILGQQIATLFDREPLDEGEQEVEFNAGGLPSGVYFYRLDVTLTSDEETSQPPQSYNQVKKMMLIK